MNSVHRKLRIRVTRPQLPGKAFRLLIGAALFSASLGLTPLISKAHACAFDFRKPDRTEIDWIVQAETLVLARPDPQNEFSYQVIDVLRGEDAEYELPFLVTSLNKRRLISNPEHAVLFRKTPDQSWAQVAYVDGDFSEILKTALTHANLWNSADYHPSRFDIFEALQTSQNRKLRDLAVRELDKAPYEMLRGLDIEFEADALLADLWTPAGYPYQSIRVLLLGLSDDDRARAEIYSYFKRVEDWDNAENIGAFSAALIELEDMAAIDYLDQVFLSDHTQPLEKLRGIITALAVHRGVSAPALSTAIDKALSELVEARPAAAPVVAQQFALFSNWSQVEALSKLVEERRLMTIGDLLAVTVYVAQARGLAPSMAPDVEKG